MRQTKPISILEQERSALYAQQFKAWLDEIDKVLEKRPTEYNAMLESLKKKKEEATAML